ncbi:MAG: SRPBCC domain-containing protein [Planctomycetes bacterium]|nr:SRPBCC domain-containing protein [Planctomycetota bacterium]
MSASPERPALAGGLTAAVERTFETPVDIVWAALTRPEILGVWFTTRAEVDLRVGGRYSNADGDCGEFLEVVEGRKLVMTWENPESCPGTRVEIQLDEPVAGSTHVRISQTGLAREADRAAQLEGWHWAIDSLESFLKTGAGMPYEPWKELQTELHRRAATKTFEEAEAERRAAGVVLAPIVASPAAAKPAAKARKGGGRKGRSSAKGAAARGGRKKGRAAKKKTSTKARRKPGRR